LVYDWVLNRTKRSPAGNRRLHFEELAQKNHQNDRKKKQEFCFLLLYYIVCFYASLEM